VRRRGGRVWVQDPATASTGVMPAAALARAGADCILDVGGLCRELPATGAA
jgi:two-component system, chemotaxis family, protein-glutamate methylesterase/glutaminase